MSNTGISASRRLLKVIPLAVFLIRPGGVVVRDLFGIDFDTLTTLLDVPLTDGTRKAAS